jgi:malyl-CoA/(S)-citramalyl-CoA lyase
VRSPKDFFAPLAVGAPAPLREIPATPSRVIHFLDPSNEKMAASVPSMLATVDVLLGNLEDGVKADRKEAARAGLVRLGQDVDFGSTRFWARLNALDSPWFLDDVTTIVPAIGSKLDVLMIPKVEGAEDIHYLDRLLAQLEAKAGLTRPILVHAILETARGVANVEEICTASPRMQGLSLGPADLAASRRMKTTRVGGGTRATWSGRSLAGRPDRGPAHRPAGPVALHPFADGRRVRGVGDLPLLRAVR